MSTLHCALENGADLYVNERQNIRHYRTRSTEERRRRKEKNDKSRFFYFARCVRKMRYNRDVIYTLILWGAVCVKIVLNWGIYKSPFLFINLPTVL